MYNNVHFCNYIKFDIVSTVPPPPPSPVLLQGRVKPPTKSSKKGRLDRTSTFRGGEGG